MIPPARTRRLSPAAQKGQAMVEFVLVLPFMLLLLFTIIDFAVALNHASDLNHVAASTARRLAVNSDTTLDPRAHALSIAEEAVRDNPSLAVVVSLPDGVTPGPSHAVCVKLTMSRQIKVIPGLEGIGPTLNMSGKASMKLEMPATFSGAAAASGQTTACA